MLWKKIKNLFQSAEESSPSNPVIHQVIERSEAEKADYEQWKTMLVRRRIMNWLSNQYAIYRIERERVDKALDFLDASSSKGFVIHFYQTNFSKKDVIYLLDYLKEQVLRLEYKVQVSDTRTYNRKNWVETSERHHLKPRTNHAPEIGKIDQKYGNITIEVTLRNDKVHQLKFQATSYKDHLFEDADDFKDLMQIILK